MSNEWRPSASLEVMQTRARILHRIRAFFHAAKVMEVSTPAMGSAAGTDPHIEQLSLTCHAPGAAARMFLHSSPEFAMKRLLAAGSGDIYQICQVFRDGEAGRFHNPEFSLLEWYRLGFDHLRLMDEVEALLRFVLEGVEGLEPCQRLSYGQAFQQTLAIDPNTLSVQQLAAVADAQGIQVEGMAIAESQRDNWLNLLMSEAVESQLPRCCFVHSFPASQASLARIHEGVAERFELFVNGVELANGFHELTDAHEQRQRFVAENDKRRENGDQVKPMDERFLAALGEGLPACAGVALGIDRLLMLACGVDHIDQVLSFPVARS